MCVTINNKMVHCFSPWEICKIVFWKCGKLFNLPPVATNFYVMKKESVFNVLKNHMNLEHTRHRSPVNFLVHIIACVAAYAIKKSHLKLQNFANKSLLLS